MDTPRSSVGTPMPHSDAPAARAIGPPKQREVCPGHWRQPIPTRRLTAHAKQEHGLRAPALLTEAENV
eukprot:2724862-Lingulodinium_polyedra.AAC.1